MTARRISHNIFGSSSLWKYSPLAAIRREWPMSELVKQWVHEQNISSDLQATCVRRLRLGGAR